jgi:hypothetical protein
MGKRRFQWPRPARVARNQARLLLLVACALFVVPVPGLAQDEVDPNQRQAQVVHASPAVGPVDVYIDGAIMLVGLNFGAVSDPIILPTGERSLILTPSGRSRDEAIVDASVPLEPGPPADLALIGPTEDLRIGVYSLDLSPLPPDLARLGAVLGTVDAGPVDLAVTGGDALFPTLEFSGASEFADVTAGTYDLEVRYEGSDTPVVLLPGTVLAPGMVYYLYIVGESALGEMQSMLAAHPAETATVVGHPAWIQSSDCTSVEAEQAVADLTVVAVSPFASEVGHAAAAVTESSFTTIGIPYADLVNQPHAIVVAESDQARTSGAACGEVGGTQSVDGSLVVGLRALPGSNAAGIAVLSPNILDPSLTNVSVFIADGLFPGAPASAGDEPTASDVEVEPTSAPVVIGEAVVIEEASPGATPEPND